MRPPGSPQDLERRRLRATELLKEDLPPVEVARIVGCDRRSVRRWNAAFRKGGGEGIKARPTPGRPPRLDEKAKRRLEKTLLKGAEAARFETDLWTCPRVAQLIKKHSPLFLSLRQDIIYAGINNTEGVSCAAQTPR